MWRYCSIATNAFDEISSSDLEDLGFDVEMKAFGIGCLWFGPTKKHVLSDDDEQFDVKEHIEKIRKSLSGMPNVSNIEIETPSILSYVINHSNVSRIYEEYDFFPLIPGLVIKFRIHLPKRIQEEFHFKTINLSAEDFDVSINYGYTTPTAIISFDATDFSANPSMAVVIVRKFLEKQVAIENHELEFNTLGPSPFHADFFLQGSPDLKDLDGVIRIRDVSEQAIGYKDIIIDYDSDFIDNDQDALRIFIGEFASSIEVYYRFVLYGYDIDESTDVIRDALAETIELQTRGGLRMYFKRLRGGPRLNRDLMISILKLEVKKLETAAYLKKAINNRELLPKSIFEYLIKRRELRLDDLPVGEIRHTILLFEERYLKNIENTTVLVAGLLGGVVGSFLTYLVGK